MAVNPLPASSYLGLDVGARRIGVAYAGGGVSLAVPLTTIEVDGTEKQRLSELVETRKVTVVVVGLPRNQSGELTAQSTLVKEHIAALLDGMAVSVVFQDESLTSVIAEERLTAQSQPYGKGDIDREAARIILQDYLDTL